MTVAQILAADRDELALIARGTGRFGKIADSPVPKNVLFSVHHAPDEWFQRFVILYGDAIGKLAMGFDAFEIKFPAPFRVPCREQQPVEPFPLHLVRVGHVTPDVAHTEAEVLVKQAVSQFAHSERNFTWLGGV